MVQVGTALEIVAFELDRQRFGLVVHDVERVLRAAASTPLPKAPAIVEGVLSLAGDPIPVLDLRARFELPSRPVGLTDMLIVTRAADRRVAIRADRVTGVIKVAAAAIREAKTVAPMAVQIAGVAVLPDGVVLLHDPAAFLTQSEAIELAKLTAAPS